MFNKIKIAALSAVVGLGALTAAPATAQADSFYFGISPAGPSFGFHHRRERPTHNWSGPKRFDCNTAQALRKADRMGINRTYVRNQNRNIIRVGGRSRGRHVTVVFAKAPNCPVIR